MNLAIASIKYLLIGGIVILGVAILITYFFFVLISEIQDEFS